ncbi:MAG: acetate--CoA ligase [Gammaproteobacteria bacterium]|nr:acetate--CoA ligase [Gammaproteobacteria bacterium]
MTALKKYPTPAAFAKTAHLNEADYHRLYRNSIEHPEAFWVEQGERFVSWFKPWDSVIKGEMNTFDVEWFSGATLNACYNCVDRHLETRADQVALIWEGNEPGHTRTMSYAQLFEVVCRFANVLKAQGIQKGARVCIYLPMIPEAVIAMLACARLGAIHSVVFAGFSAESLKARLIDAKCSLLITADEGFRGEKTVPLKRNSDEAIADCPHIQRVIVVQHSQGDIPWNPARDVWYHEALKEASPVCAIELMDAADPLFILYTSGSTGQPKGVLHGTGGYLVYAAMTHYFVFDYHEGEVYWCTADVGWITGHTYTVYGPLANGATTLLFEGIPSHPSFSRYWDIVDQHQVNIFYTAPTAIRALRCEGDEWVKKSSRKSLRLLGSVGEPMNAAVWEWYYHVVGEGRCPIVDTWWQTETGGILITTLPGATPMLPGSVAWPFFGIVPEIVNDDGVSLSPGQVGNLIIKQPWPGLMQTIYGDHQRFIDTYFKLIAGRYLAGDAASVDEEGYFTIKGRNDDVIKLSGHRLGTGEIESALVTHSAVSEAAVVGIPNALTGEGIYAFVTLKSMVVPTDALKKELTQHVRHKIGPIAIIEVIQWASGLPKTRSGKIMRRILRKIACRDVHELGDLSTLADMGVVQQLVADR